MLPLQNATKALAALSQKAITPGSSFSLDELKAFHDSVEFKLRSAAHFLQQLANLLQDFPMTSYRKSGPNLFLVNVNLDGFLTSIVSASDVFGREINILFGRIVIRPRF